MCVLKIINNCYEQYNYKGVRKGRRGSNWPRHGDVDALARAFGARGERLCVHRGPQGGFHRYAGDLPPDGAYRRWVLNPGWRHWLLRQSDQGGSQCMAGGQ